MFKKYCAVIMTLSFLMFSTIKAEAQSFEFIRDAEIENALRFYATPIFQQAGVDPNAVQIHLINDPQINAFVAIGLHLFINTGLIVRTENASQLIGVIAHESGHIAGGHLVRGRGAAENAGTLALAGTLAGLGLLAAGATQANRSYDAMRKGDPFAAGSGSNYIQGATAAILAGQDVAMKNYFSFSRSIEGAADTAGLQFLDNLQISSRGLLEFMQTLEGEEMLSTNRQDPYIRTHPLTSDRIDEIRHHVETSPFSEKTLPPDYEAIHLRIKAKLKAYLQPMTTTLYYYKDNDKSIPSRYARAIAYYRKPDLDHALPLIDELIAENPQDPYFHEMKGQMLLENNRLSESIPEYKLAVKYLPNNALIRGELGLAQVESNDPNELNNAIENLQLSVKLDPEDSTSWRELATIYMRQNNTTMVEASMAEYALLSGSYRDAYHHAEVALKSLKPGTSIAIRMSDIRSQAQQLQEQTYRSR